MPRSANKKTVAQVSTPGVPNQNSRKSQFMKTFEVPDPSDTSSGQISPDLDGNEPAVVVPEVTKKVRGKKKIAHSFTPVIESDCESEKLACEGKNSKGFVILTPPSYSVPPPAKRAKTTPKESQISPAYKISDSMNVYLLKKSWDKASRVYVQLERLYVNSQGKTAVFNFSFDVKYLQSMKGAITELMRYYENALEETD